MVQHDESDNTNEGSLVHLQTISSFEEMMGLEACESGDEEYLKRRVLAEVHLDYIYTQQHNYINLEKSEISSPSL
ncbi:hypothetical protein CTI12_AA181210 [Artemisia annua]|uniref:Phytosulfokine n=1 Tax=Artemisia annua TaxID=35608 RepID=A0A2U1P8I0_ARTAN|nr:hypothetical protein CTI12_AA181210 [Artemisia annua]